MILTVGTRGDVQPYVALGRGMRAHGWDVVVATSPRFEPLVRTVGLDFAPLRADFVAMMDAPQDDVLGARNPFQMMREIGSTVFPMMRRMLDGRLGRIPRGGAHRLHPKALAGPHLAERLDIPCVVAPVVPIVVPTSAFPAPGVNVHLGKFFNRLTYTLLAHGTRKFQSLIDDWRRETLGLAPFPKKAGMYTVRGRAVPVVHGVSRHVVPRPPDWPSHTVMAGYWFLEDEDWRPPSSLEEFLSAGRPRSTLASAVWPGGRPRVCPAPSYKPCKASGPGPWSRSARTPTRTSSFLARHHLPARQRPAHVALSEDGGRRAPRRGRNRGRRPAGGETDRPLPVHDRPALLGATTLRAGCQPTADSREKIDGGRLTDALTAVLHDSAVIEHARRLGEKLRADDGVARAVDYLRSSWPARPKVEPAEPKVNDGRPPAGRRAPYPKPGTARLPKPAYSSGCSCIALSRCQRRSTSPSNSASKSAFSGCSRCRVLPIIFSQSPPGSACPSSSGS